MAEPLVSDHAHGAAAPDFVDHVQDLLSRDLPKAPEIGPQDCMAFELAVVEVVTNAVQHTEATHRAAVELDFKLEIRPSLMLARLYEIGAEPFEIPESDAMPSEIEESGRGLALARQLLSTITCERRGTTNLWTLTRQPGSNHRQPGHRPRRP